jgi:tetratricopeptide (TPR) repeat protein
MVTWIWEYVAPNRRTEKKLAFRHCEDWLEIEDLNRQRLARVLEFQECVAFVGARVSSDLGYPRWAGLLPGFEPELNVSVGVSPESNYQKILDSVKNKIMDPPQALQIAEGILGNGDADRGRDQIISYLRDRFSDSSRRKQLALEPHVEQTASSLLNLLKYPIRKFITTNYDQEIEKALKKGRGDVADSEIRDLAFSQSDASRSSLFAIARARKNRNTVFHIHGILGVRETTENFHADGAANTSGSPTSPAANGQHFSVMTRDLVLTDRDYNYWYLSNDIPPANFQRNLGVLLHSNPLFFVGYGLEDYDLVRVLRHLSVSLVNKSVSDSVFVLFDNQGKEDKLFYQAQQIKKSINIIPFEGKKGLTVALEELHDDCVSRRVRWRRQPKPKNTRPSVVSVLPYDAVESPVDKTADCLFKQENLVGDDFLRRLGAAVETHSVVALVGPTDAGKYVKTSQLLQTETGRKFRPVVFSTHGNEDIYTYLARVARSASVDPLPPLVGSQNVVDHLEASLRNRTERPLLLVISGIDQFLDLTFTERYDQGSDTGTADVSWNPRNVVERDLIALIAKWATKWRRNHILLTCRALPSQLSMVHAMTMNLNGTEAAPFTPGELGLTESEHKTLLWHLQDQHSATMIAAAYVGNSNQHATPLGRADRIAELVGAIGTSPAERGTRIVQHVTRALDQRKQSTPHNLEKLLKLLSCFRAPVPEKIVDVCHKLSASSKDFPPAALMGGHSPGFKQDLDLLLSHRLVEIVGPLAEQRVNGEMNMSLDTSESAFLYLVPPVVRRFCRKLLAGSRHPEKRVCGVHGFLSRGPFNDPGSADTARELFRTFGELAFHCVDRVGIAHHAPQDILQSAATGGAAACFSAKTGEFSEDLDTSARLYITATLEVLRSNFSCNSVPNWGKFAEYVDMCCLALDLVRNFARVFDDTWTPGEPDIEPSERGVVSPEEILFLYNELGLAYYNEGMIQDAINVWGSAFEWQKAIALKDHHQGEMYAASLNSHLGLAYMQIGRMDTARELITTALSAARFIGNRDLAIRLQGVMARIDYFRGSIGSARDRLQRTIDQLEQIGNRRAQSYFLRHMASLEIRLEKYDRAEEALRLSLAIAASENSPDNVAFAREMLGRIYSVRGKHKEAIAEFRAALVKARRLGIARLEADAALGIAKIQLMLGDATAARDRAIEALKIANGSLLVQRQIKALLILGRAIADLRDVGFGIELIQHAKSLAAENHFRLAEQDADKLLAELHAEDS